MFDEIIAAMKKALPGLRRAFELSIRYSVAREEREAWDRYVSGVSMQRGMTPEGAASWADALLLVRQETFGSREAIADAALETGRSSHVDDILGKKP